MLTISWSISSLPSRELLPPTDGSLIIPKPRMDTLSPVEGFVLYVICPEGISSIAARLLPDPHAASPAAAPAAPRVLKNDLRDISLPLSVYVLSSFVFIVLVYSGCASYLTVDEMPFDIYCAERSGRAQVFACSAADAPLLIDGRYSQGIRIARLKRHHSYGSGRTVTRTVAAFLSVRYRDTVFPYPYSMPYTDGRFFCFRYRGYCS